MKQCKRIQEKQEFNSSISRFGMYLFDKNKKILTIKIKKERFILPKFKWNKARKSRENKNSIHKYQDLVCTYSTKSKQYSRNFQPTIKFKGVYSLMS